MYIYYMYIYYVYVRVLCKAHDTKKKSVKFFHILTYKM